MRSAILAMLFAAGSPATALASTFYPKTVKCPVGGERFTYDEFASYSTFGSLPDGQPIGSALFPIEIPQCPKNGLVLYQEFDAATVTRLKPLVEGADYQALRKSETRYYLAYWLRTRLGESGSAPLWMLLAATWEAKNFGKAELVRRYSLEFVAKVLSLPTDGSSLEVIALRARAANTLRELGQFEEAEKIRATTKVAPDAGGDEPDAGENRKGWTDYLAGLAPAIARRDPARAPIDLVGDRQAVFRCLEPEVKRDEPAVPLTAFETEFCVRPAIATLVAKQRETMKDRLR